MADPVANRVVHIQRGASLPRSAGGKALGLQALVEAGFDVPPALVVLPCTETLSSVELVEELGKLGPGPYAVRSSALGEDGAQSSFAGQYLSVLDVKDADGVMRAVAACEESLQTERAVAYTETHAASETPQMAVVVQVMVQATIAGVVFSQDPVSGRRDRVVIDAVAGLGEALVSGHARPDHYVTRLDGTVALQELVGQTPLLSTQCTERITVGALRAAREWGSPVDMEWAIDEQGTLWWLQARPVTRSAPDPRELDSPLRDAGDVHTRCNIGEMMPGAVTPLTWSITGRGIDRGLQDMMVRVGAQDERTEELVYVRLFFNHMFLNLTALARIASAVVGSTTERLGLALCGRVVPEVDPGDPLPLPLRLINGLRYGRYLLGAEAARRALEREIAAASVVPDGDARDVLPWLEREIQRLYRVYAMHMQSSATAGALTPALLEILAAGSVPTDQHHGALADLLRVDDDVESADIAGSMHAMSRLMQGRPDLRHALRDRTDPEAVAWLESPASEELGQLWRQYLVRHGHRAVRELELSQPEWSEDCTPLLAALRLGGDARVPPQAGTRASMRPSRGVLAWLVPRARRAVSCREATKAQLAWMTTHVKRGVRVLATRLVAEHALVEGELVYFLQIGELVDFVHTRDPRWLSVARQRRDAQRYQRHLRFPEVFVGRAEPELPGLDVSAGEDWIRGKPVSGGRVEGRARVVTQLADALDVQPGEILVAAVTDVGWTPCFGVIAGVVTEVGSAVSHGAVVAREYGIPAIVNARGATRRFTTGERLILDADRGVVFRPDAEMPDPESLADVR